MKILHTADIHIGCLRGLETVSEKERLLRYRAVLRRIFLIATKEKVDAIVIAGDIFDRKNVKAREKDILTDALLKWTKIPVLAVVGNHDMLEPQLTSLHTLGKFREAGRIKHFSLAEHEPHIVKVAGCIFILIPYTGDNRGYAKTVERLVVFGSSRSVRDKSQPIIVVGHEMVVGSSNDQGRVFRKGVTIPNLPAVCAYLYGDIHKRQNLCGMKNAWYCGSPAQHRFSERDNKGVVILDTNKPTEPRFVRIRDKRIKPLLTVEAKTAKEATRLLRTPKYRRAWVRIKVPVGVSTELYRAGEDDAVVKAIEVSPGSLTETEKARRWAGDPIAAVGPWLIGHKGFTNKEARRAEEVVRRWRL